MFLGTHTPRLDEKGRLFLPAKYRERMAGGLVVTRGQERSLFIYPMDEFVRVADQMRQAPTTSKVARDYMRVFLSGASDEIPDKQGRFTIPANLRQYAGLDREVTVIGAGLAPRGLGQRGLERLPRADRAELRRHGRGGHPRPVLTDPHLPAPPSTTTTSTTSQHHLSAGLQPLRSRDDFPRPGRRSGWGPAPR